MSDSRNRSDSMAWWREARFGMFIHWGLYAIPGGVWKGRVVPGIGEWIMHREQIPVAEYEQLAGQFYPAKFNAEEWVRLATAAGMRYLTITSKHHDGFALFNSRASSFNVADATPFRRDVIAELAEACRSHGVPLCFYYSQSQDWHEPGGLGNTWDFGPDEEKDFQSYLDTKVKPQLRELLTRYGPVGMIWFDTPKSITVEQSLDLKRFVKDLQPDCLVSGRIGNDVGDYGSLGDNEHPAGPVTGDWETPCTLNDTWGYKSYDENWKSPEELLEVLVGCASKGVNYLLNVGPTAEGVIPQPSVDRLRTIGEWLRANGEAIYGSSASPFPYDLSRVRMTSRGTTLYFIFRDTPPARFAISGIRNRVLAIRSLDDARESIGIEQRIDAGIDTLTLSFPVAESAATAGDLFPVYALELDGAPNVDQRLLQQPDGSVALPAHVATIVPGAGKTARATIRSNGAVTGWNDPATSLAWTFHVHTAGTYGLVVDLLMDRDRLEQYDDYRLTVSIGDPEVEGANASETVGLRDVAQGEGGDPWLTVQVALGDVSLVAPGEVAARASIDCSSANATDGLALATIRLEPRPGTSEAAR